jgi:hypothetical protein
MDLLALLTSPMGHSFPASTSPLPAGTPRVLLFTLSDSVSPRLEIGVFRPGWTIVSASAHEQCVFCFCQRKEEERGEREGRCM